MNLWQKEPAVIIGLISAALSLGVAFGLPLSMEQKAAIIAFLTILGSVITRSQVSSPATVAATQTNQQAAVRNAGGD